jgi:hypothetical protein
MKSRKRILQRLSTLYGLVEEARSMEMRRAALLLEGAEQAVATQEMVIWAVNSEGRDALEQNDRLGWRQAGVQSTLAGWNIELLELIRRERGEQSEEAKELYRASRIQSEQMGGLLETTTKEAEAVDRRREQALSDDRYLSRLRWRERR